MKQYKNLIFDLGGVVLDIDYNKTIEAFEQLGIPHAGRLYSKAAQNPLFNELEKGLISDEDFFAGMRDLADISISDKQIRKAWNALIIELPEENVKLLQELKKEHRLFLLSNTNAIHEKEYREIITGQYGKFILEELFEKMYLSHHIQMRKPDPEIFEFILKDSNLNPAETCFIDDSPQHVAGARLMNIRSYLLNNQSLFKFVKSLAVSV
jgi:putative hydrolase of the HAD superfamily